MGVVSLLYATGMIGFGAVRIASIMQPRYTVLPTGQKLGIDVTSTARTYPFPLSTLVPGQSYKWTVSLANTGTVAWTASWATLRIGIDGSTVTSTGCSLGPNEVAIDFQCESCPSGTDVPACREQIDSTGWNMRSLTSEITLVCDSTSKMCTADLGGLAVGGTTSFEVAVTVPSTYTTGTYPFIVNGVAQKDKNFIVDAEVDNLTLGTVSGDVVLTFIGALSIIGAGVTLAMAAIKP
ncbi:MAG: hypothetical protein ACE5KD_00600 [Candidatus Bathyarchaeia archaeon]